MEKNTEIKTGKILRIIFLGYLIVIAWLLFVLIMINIAIKFEENEQKKKHTLQRYSCGWTACNNIGRYSRRDY